MNPFVIPKAYTDDLLEFGSFHITLLKAIAYRL